MIFSGKRADYTVTRTATGFAVSDKLGLDGADSLANVERLSFADAALALDTSGSGGQPTGFIRPPSTGRPIPPGLASRCGRWMLPAFR